MTKPSQEKNIKMDKKQAQFNAAMERFHSQKIFQYVGPVVAGFIVSLQLILVYFIWRTPLGVSGQIAAFIIAYLLTDLLNGLVHMIMDHNEDYDLFYGPLAAHFHLHHKTPKYIRKPILKVYFHETGAKLWLLPFLVIVLVLILTENLTPIVSHTLVYIGVLSSFAEVSHYLCHTSHSKTVHLLGRLGILLSWEKHVLHHERDNTHYAFLNGVSDPLINVIARKFFSGYKNTTDRHFAYYVSSDESQRF